MAKKKTEQKRGRGRPALPKDEVMRTRHFRSSDGDHESQCAIATAKGLSWSEWARETLARAARRAS